MCPDRMLTVLKRQGMSIRAIARELGLSRVTVRRYLREPRATKLDPHIEYVLSRVEAARTKWTPATVLLREIRERGYAGGIGQLKAYLAPLKHGEPEPVVRFETEPGEQMQTDFAHVRRGRDPLLAIAPSLVTTAITSYGIDPHCPSPWTQGTNVKVSPQSLAHVPESACGKPIRRLYEFVGHTRLKRGVSRVWDYS
jgi:transposase